MKRLIEKMQKDYSKLAKEQKNVNLEVSMKTLHLFSHSYVRLYIIILLILYIRGFSVFPAFGMATSMGKFSKSRRNGKNYSNQSSQVIRS